MLAGSRENYDSIKEYLCTQKGFIKSTTNAFVIFSPLGTAIDLLPFGALQIDEDVTLDSKALTSINANGFMEVYKDGTQVKEVITGHAFSVATLPAIVLLKLIAYDDRPEHRQKDARDIANIVIHYFEMEAALIYEKHADLFEDEKKGRVLEEISAVVIGREIKKILGENRALHSRLYNIIDAEIKNEENSAFIRNMAQETGMFTDEMAALLKNMLLGLEMNTED